MTSSVAKATRRGIALGDSLVPWWAAGLDYFATPVELWESSLQSLAAMGFRCVDVRIPWSLHELAPGEWDFGMKDPALDLRRFLRAVQATGLLASVRPGPRHVAAADLDDSGVPERVLWDRDCMALTAKGNPLVLPRLLGSHPEPSLHSQAYLAEGERWLAALAVQLSPLLYPAGPIVMVSLGSERVGRLTTQTWGDFRPEALDGFRAFLKAKYERPAALKEAHQAHTLDFNNVTPPKAPVGPNDAPLSAHLDWVAFQQRTFGRVVERIVEQLGQSGLDDVAFSMPQAIPWETGRDSVGRLDSASRPALAATEQSMLTARSESAQRFGVSSMRAGYAFGSSRESDDELWFEALCQLAYGAQHFIVSPSAPRARFIGGLLDEEGLPTPLGERWAHLLEVLDRVQFHTLEPRISAQIVVPRRLRWAASAHSLRPLSSAALGLRAEILDRSQLWSTSSEAGREILEAEAFLNTLVEELRARRVPCRFLSDEHFDSALHENAWTVVPCVGGMDEALTESIRFALRRGAPVSVGPRAPSGFQLLSQGEIPATLDEDPVVLRQLIGALIGAGRLQTADAEPPSIDVRFFDGDGSGLAFVVNPRHEDVVAHVACPGFDAKLALSQTPVHSFAERFEIPVSARSVTMLELRAT